MMRSRTLVEMEPGTRLDRRLRRDLARRGPIEQQLCGTQDFGGTGAEPVKPAVLRDDLFQRFLEGGAEVVAFQRIGDVGGEEADLVAAVIGGALVFHAPEILAVPSA